MGQQNIAVIDATPQDEVDNIEVNENIKDDELLDEENKKIKTETWLNQEEVSKTLDATQLYLSEIGYSPLLTAEEEVYFARRALKGCEASRKRMIVSNLRLVEDCPTL